MTVCCWKLTCRYTNPEGDITGLVFSPISNFIAFTSSDGSFSRWTDPIPSNLTSPITSDAVQAKTLDKLLDDEFGDEDDLNIEERGEDIADDWIVDDEGDGGYARDDDIEYTKGRREVGKS
jgi:chromosome transmission fidelity protein 4